VFLPALAILTLVYALTQEDEVVVTSDRYVLQVVIAGDERRASSVCRLVHLFGTMTEEMG